jgi:hypothetical protein
MHELLTPVSCEKHRALFTFDKMSAKADEVKVSCEKHRALFTFEMNCQGREWIARLGSESVHFGIFIK